MVDLPATIELEFAKALVQASVTGGGELIRKVPALFRRQGRTREQQATAELDRGRELLARAAPADLDREIVRHEAMWELRVRDLLAEHPDLGDDIRRLTADIRAALDRQGARYEQRVSTGGAGAMGPGATAIVHNYAPPPAAERD